MVYHQGNIEDLRYEIKYLNEIYIRTFSERINFNHAIIEYTLKSMRSAVFLKKYADVLKTGVVIASVAMARPNLSPGQISKSTILILRELILMSNVYSFTI